MSSSKRLLLNDLLKLDDVDLERTRIKLNLWNGANDPLEEFVRDPEIVNSGWLFWRESRPSFQVGQIAICLVRFADDKWLLTTVKAVTKNFERTNDVSYQGEELDEFEPYYGRLIVKYYKDSRATVRRAASIMDKLEISELLPSIYDGANFPGYERVRLTHAQLETIIVRHKRDWVEALKHQKAVYLITDLDDGRQYVGSATAENGMLLRRWQAYVTNQHGGNKELRALVDNKGPDHAKKYFQYSILENYNARVDDRVILDRESWWKLTLGSRVFGLNSN